MLVEHLNFIFLPVRLGTKTLKWWILYIWNGWILILSYHFSFIPVLPPVLVPRHSEFAPGHSLLTFQQQHPEPMPNNVSFSQNGFVHSPMGGASHPQMGSQTITGVNQPPSPVVSPSSQSPLSPYCNFPGKFLNRPLCDLPLLSSFSPVYPFSVFSVSLSQLNSNKPSVPAVTAAELLVDALCLEMCTCSLNGIISERI